MRFAHECRSLYYIHLFGRQGTLLIRHGCWKGRGFLRVGGIEGGCLVAFIIGQPYLFLQICESKYEISCSHCPLRLKRSGGYIVFDEVFPTTKP